MVVGAKYKVNDYFLTFLGVSVLQLEGRKLTGRESSSGRSISSRRRTRLTHSWNSWNVAWEILKNRR